IVDSLTPQQWETHSAGRGTKGERQYDWGLVPLWRLQLSEQERAYGHYLLVRRSRDEKQERAYYVVYAPREQADLKTLAQVAGRRWEIECGFEETKGECGLDHYEVRQWHSWHRHITLSLLAHAVLAVLRIREKKNAGGADRAQCGGTA
ncbi:transposase, partial [Xenorhabdus innexi]